jgi:hypothetical protein
MCRLIVVVVSIFFLIKSNESYALEFKNINDPNTWVHEHFEDIESHEIKDFIANLNKESMDNWGMPVAPTFNAIIYGRDLINFRKIHDVNFDNLVITYIVLYIEGYDQVYIRMTFTKSEEKWDLSRLSISNKISKFF